MALSFAGLSDLLGGARGGSVRAAPAAAARARGGPLFEPGKTVRRSIMLLPPGFRGALCALAETDRLLVAIDDVQWLDRSSAAALAFTLRRLEGAGWTSCSPSGSRRACRAPSGSIVPRPSSRSSGSGSSRQVRPRCSACWPFISARPSSSCIAPHPRHVGREPVLRARAGSGARACGAASTRRTTAGSGHAPRAGRAAPRRPTERRRRPCLPLRFARPAEPVATRGRGRATCGRRASAGRRGSRRAPRARSGPIRAPAAASGIVEATDARTRRALHRRIAEVAEQPDERARHLALASEGPDESVAAALAAAAATVAARGAPEAAAEPPSERAA